MSVWFWERIQSAFQAAAVINDLLKAFHCINNELLIAEVNDYGFDNSSLIFIFSYPSEKTKELNSSFSCSTEILFGVSQSSILAPMYLTLIYVTSFLKKGILNTLVLLMKLPRILVYQKWFLSQKNLKNLYRTCFTCSQKTF